MSIQNSCNRPQMADDLMQDLIDGAVIRGLGLDGEWVATIRRELGRGRR